MEILQQEHKFPSSQGQLHQQGWLLPIPREATPQMLRFHLGSDTYILNDDTAWYSANG